MRLGIPSICRLAAALQSGCKKPPLPRTQYFEEIPAVLQFNRFIRSGYRVNYTYCECCKSIFAVHNESGNIWSHILPLAVGLILVGSGWLPYWEAARREFAWSVMSILLCLLGSVLYHTFLGHHVHSRNWLVVDVCGIYTVLMGSQWACILNGFPCNPWLGKLFATLYYAVGAVSLILSVSAKTSKRQGLPMVPLMCIRLGCLFARMLLGGSSQQAILTYSLAEFISFVGGVMNVLRVPEKWCLPNKGRSTGAFDYFGNSHQIMHILVALAMVAMHIGLYKDVYFFKSPKAICLI